MWWKKYLSIPFQFGKMSFTSCDCGGLVLLVFKEELKKDIPLLFTAGAKDKHKEFNKYINFFEEIKKEDVQEYDVFVQYGDNWHIGLVVNKNLVLESTIDRGVLLRNIKVLNLEHTKYYRLKK